ncbi:MAG: DUF2934 domain-containing protein [Candidatus Acidiferrales bacterium]
MERTPSRDEIELRAYEIYEQRGGEDGHAEEDWFTAERELAERPRPENIKSGSRIKEAVSQAMQQKSRSAGTAHN